MPKHFTAELCMLLTLLLVVATLCASSALPTGGGGMRSLDVQGLAVVQVPPELERQGRELNQHASELQASFVAAGRSGDALAYLRKTDKLMAEGHDFNRNWQSWLSEKGYPFKRITEQNAAIDRLSARIHVLLSTVGHTNEQAKQGLVLSPAQLRAQHAYIAETSREMQSIRPVDFASMLAGRPGAEGLVEGDGTSATPLSDIDSWQ